MKGEEDAGGMVQGAGFELSAQLVGHVDVVVAHVTVVLRRRVLSSPMTRTATHSMVTTEFKKKNDHDHDNDNDNDEQATR